MTAIQHARNDGFAATLGKAAVGAAVPLGVIGATVHVPNGFIGALPAALMGLGGGIVAAGATKVLEGTGMGQTTAGIVGGFGAAGAILGVASLYGLTHGGVGLYPALALAAMPAFGAITGGLTAGLWH